MASEEGILLESLYTHELLRNLMRWIFALNSYYLKFIFLFCMAPEEGILFESLYTQCNPISPIDTL